MKIGIHPYLWCTEWNNDQLHLIQTVKDYGFDYIEIPLMAPHKFDADAINKELARVGLAVATSTVLNDDADISSTDPAIWQRGVDYLKWCVDASVSIGSMCLTGVLYAAHAPKNPKRPTKENWEASAKGLGEIYRYAKERGLTIGVEPTSRFDSTLLNTCAQYKEFKKMIGEDVKLHLDSYHMNIEESDFYNVTKLAGDDLIAYHLCEGNRGAPGSAHVDFDGIFKALKEINYQGNVALESFIDYSENMQTWVWRRMADSEDQFVKDSLTFIATMRKKYDI